MIRSLVSPDPLKGIPCFSGLKSGDAEWLRGCLREKSYSKGETVFLEGEPCPGLFIVKSGAVKLYRTSMEGEEQIVRILRQGGCFECAPLFDRGPNPVSAQTLEASELYLLPTQVFYSLIKAHPEIMMEIAAVLAMRLRSLLGTLEDFSFKPVYSRLANLLLQLGEPRGDAQVVSSSQQLNQQHLACMLGCSRQIVNTSLRKMVKAGMIKMEGRRIVILKRGELRELSGSLYKIGPKSN